MQNNNRPGPPRARASRSARCLDRAYESSQRGGTLIVEEGELEAHDDRLASVESYRPERCANCLRKRPHGHGRRVRGLRAWCGLDVLFIELRRYRCPGCRAVWTVVPRFVARCLWRAWSTVRGALSGARSSPVPPRTRRRWRARLRTCTRKLVTVIATAGDAALRRRAGEVGLDASRRELIERLGGLAALEALSGLVHRLRPGLRVM